MNDSSATLPLTLYVALSLCPITIVGLSLIYYLSVCHLYTICRSVTYMLSVGLSLIHYRLICHSHAISPCVLAIALTRVLHVALTVTQTLSVLAPASTLGSATRFRQSRGPISHAVQSVMRFSLSHCSISHAVQSVTPFNGRTEHRCDKRRVQYRRSPDALP